ncbi:unnamed protein product [Thelazia callipaeda]|uniref:RRM domain-containing protein n=1 Tax=Thelazia callipaeda TaxID=103827 RepID=A0A158RB76_THECL|nr:unnamed protein product [Thelazia callipaeda]
MQRISSWFEQLPLRRRPTTRQPNDSSSSTQPHQRKSKSAAPRLRYSVSAVQNYRHRDYSVDAISQSLISNDQPQIKMPASWNRQETVTSPCRDSSKCTSASLSQSFTSSFGSTRKNIRTNPWISRCRPSVQTVMFEMPKPTNEEIYAPMDCSTSLRIKSLDESTCSSGYGSQDSSPESSVHSPDWQPLAVNSKKGRLEDKAVECNSIDVDEALGLDLEVDSELPPLKITTAKHDRITTDDDEHVYHELEAFNRLSLLVEDDVASSDSELASSSSGSLRSIRCPSPIYARPNQHYCKSHSRHHYGMYDRRSDNQQGAEFPSISSSFTYIPCTTYRPAPKFHPPPPPPPPTNLEQAELNFLAELDAQIAELQLKSAAVRQLVDKARERQDARARKAQLYRELAELRRAVSFLMMNIETNYVRLRGLPFAAKEQDVRDFLQGVYLHSVTFTLTSNGRASGECYVELDEQEAVKEALKLDRNEISGRYIEVFTVSDAELSMMIRHGVIRGSGGDADSRFASNYVVRLRGLPYSATIEDIKEFFSGLEVADAVIDKEPGGRPSGEAFVRLATKEHAELALERSKNYMGSRYVEVFRSSADEMDNSYYASRGIPPPTSGPVPLRGISPTLDFRYRDRYGDYGRYGRPIRLSSVHPRPSPYDRPYYDRDRYYRYGARYDPEFDEAMYDPTVKVFMRGLPYSVTVYDIEEFFRPLNCAEIKLGYNEERRLSGDALVTFSTMAEAREALSRNKNNMGTRYSICILLIFLLHLTKSIIFLLNSFSRFLEANEIRLTFRYIELFPATNIPHPIKTMSFRSANGAPNRMSGAPRPLYSSFAEDDETSAYGCGIGGQQYYNDQYEGRQSKYGRDWGEPARTSW